MEYSKIEKQTSKEQQEEKKKEKILVVVLEFLIGLFNVSKSVFSNPPPLNCEQF